MIRRPALLSIAACVALLGLGPHGCTVGPAASSTSKATPTTSVKGAPSLIEVTRAVRRLVGRADAGFPVASVADVHMVRDASDRWWVSAAAQPPAGQGLETPTVIMVKEGVWKLMSYGTTPDMSQVPKKIQGVLWPGWHSGSS